MRRGASRANTPLNLVHFNAGLSIFEKYEKRLLCFNTFILFFLLYWKQIKIRIRSLRLSTENLKPLCILVKLCVRIRILALETLISTTVYVVKNRNTLFFFPLPLGSGLVMLLVPLLLGSPLHTHTLSLPPFLFLCVFSIK